ncbi:MAG: hypothetical protein NUV50_07200 [Rhodospirillales bacterium]|nr:hypothetical protein [Rhodospirillales bacterium]
MLLGWLQIIWTSLLVLLAGGAVLAWRKRKPRLFFAASILVGLGIWAGFRVPIPIPSHPVGSTGDMTKVRFVVSGHEFRIPKAYLYYMPQWRGMAEGDEPILMRASAIDLIPISKSDENLFKGLKYSYNTVLFDLNYTPKNSLYSDRYLRPEALATCKMELENFLTCASDSYQSVVFIYKIDNNNIIFECSDDIAVSEISANLCSVEVFLFPHVYVDFKFDRRRLNEGPEYVERIRQLLMGFYVGPVSAAR